MLMYILPVYIEYYKTLNIKLKKNTLDILWARQKGCQLDLRFSCNCRIWFKIRYSIWVKHTCTQGHWKIWNLFPRFQLTISQHWFRWWIVADEATIHHPNKRRSILLTYLCVIPSRWVNVMSWITNFAKVKSFWIFHMLSTLLSLAWSVILWQAL